jgi:hypothetical protein
MAIQSKVPIVPIIFENYSHLADEKNKILKRGKIRCRGKIFINDKMGFINL